MLDSPGKREPFAEGHQLVDVDVFVRGVAQGLEADDCPARVSHDDHPAAALFAKASHGGHKAGPHVGGLDRVATDVGQLAEPARQEVVEVLQGGRVLEGRNWDGPERRVGRQSHATHDERRAEGQDGQFFLDPVQQVDPVEAPSPHCAADEPAVVVVAVSGKRESAVS